MFIIRCNSLIESCIDCWNSLRWRHNWCDSVSNHQPHHCLLNRLFRRRSKKTSKLRVTGLCVGNSSGTGEFPAQMASNAEYVSIWWRHHGCGITAQQSIKSLLITAVPREVNSSAPWQNGRHFADDIFRCIFVNEKFYILIKISLNFVP